jgi:hypothetical protein
MMQAMSGLILILTSTIAAAGCPTGTIRELGQQDGTSAITGGGTNQALQSAVSQMMPSGQGWTAVIAPALATRKVTWPGGVDWRKGLRPALTSVGACAQVNYSTHTVRVLAAGSPWPSTEHKVPIKPYTGLAAGPASRHKASRDRTRTKVQPVMPRKTAGSNTLAQTDLTPAPTATTAPIVAPQRPSADPIAAPSGSVMALLAEAEPGDIIYAVRAGQGVREVFTQWAKKAGWTLIWQSPVDYNIDVNFTFPPGTRFKQATKQVLHSFWLRTHALVGEPYRNKVLIVKGRDS